MPETTCPEANYLTRDNIVVPAHYPAALVTEMETRARAEIGARNGTTVTSGSIKKAKN
jgi:hypothetical protein